jgi:hypothetical protein
MKMTTNKQYYIVENDQDVGPLTFEELKTKKLSKNTLVWTEGMQNWAMAGDMDDLKELFFPVTPLPPVFVPRPSPPGFSNPSRFKPQRLTTDRGFWLALLLAIVTFGIYGWYLIYAFAKETNIACREDGKRTRGLIGYVLLSLITFGIYGIVWWCQRISRCNFYLAKNGKPEGLQVSTYLLTLFLLGWLTLGVMHLVVFCKQLYLQNAVNRTYNELNNL